MVAPIKIENKFANLKGHLRRNSFTDSHSMHSGPPFPSESYSSDSSSEDGIHFENVSLLD